MVAVSFSEMLCGGVSESLETQLISATEPRRIQHRPIERTQSVARVRETKTNGRERRSRRLIGTSDHGLDSYPSQTPSRLSLGTTGTTDERGQRQSASICTARRVGSRVGASPKTPHPPLIRTGVRRLCVCLSGLDDKSKTVSTCVSTCVRACILYFSLRVRANCDIYSRGIMSFSCCPTHPYLSNPTPSHLSSV